MDVFPKSGEAWRRYAFVTLESSAVGFTFFSAFMRHGWSFYPSPFFVIFVQIFVVTVALLLIYSLVMLGFDRSLALIGLLTSMLILFLWPGIFSFIEQ